VVPRVVPAALAICALSLVAHARGDDAIAVRIELKAHEGCPSADEFFERVRARTNKLRRGADGESARSIRIVVERAGSKSKGTMELEDEEPRSITGSTCAEVIDALALVAALYGNEPEPPAAPPVDEEPTAPPPVATTPAPAPIAAPPSIEAPARPPVSGRTLRVALGLAVDAYALDAGGTRLGPSAFLEIARSGRVLAPSLRLTGTRVSSATLTTAAGSTDLTWTWLRLDACPLLFAAGIFEARPCAHLAGGAIDAGVSANTNPSPSVRPWFAGGASARLSSFLGPVVAEARLGVTLPFVRYEFMFGGDVPVHRAPLAILEGGLALAVSFP